MHFAAVENFEMAALLVAKGAEINIPDDRVLSFFLAQMTSGITELISRMDLLLCIKLYTKNSFVLSSSSLHTGQI